MRTMHRKGFTPVLVGVGSAVVGATLVLLQGAVVPEDTDDPGTHAEPAKVVRPEGGDRATVTLTTEAAERIDLQTAAVDQRRGTGALVVPYGALLYDPEGGTWVYTRTDPLSFRRSPVVVDAIKGERVLVDRGPARGTTVVTVGAAELWGAEFGVGH